MLIAKTTRFNHSIEMDLSKPDGTPRKLLDVSRINKLGWKAKIQLEQGLDETYKWFVKSQQNSGLENTKKISLSHKETATP
jgi:GDP-L-fucose synthase